MAETGTTSTTDFTDFTPAKPAMPLLETLYNYINLGRSGIFILHGPPGIGKTFALRMLNQKLLEERQQKEQQFNEVLDGKLPEQPEPVRAVVPIYADFRTMDSHPSYNKTTLGTGIEDMIQRDYAFGKHRGNMLSLAGIRSVLLRRGAMLLLDHFEALEARLGRTGLWIWEKRFEDSLHSADNIKKAELVESWQKRKEQDKRSKSSRWSKVKEKIYGDMQVVEHGVRGESTTLEREDCKEIRTTYHLETGALTIITVDSSYYLPRTRAGLFGKVPDSHVLKLDETAYRDVTSDRLNRLLTAQFRYLCQQKVDEDYFLHDSPRRRAIEERMEHLRTVIRNDDTVAKAEL